MDEEYIAAKARILAKNTKEVQTHVIKAFGDVKGQALFNGLFPNLSEQVVSKVRKKKSAA